MSSRPKVVLKGISFSDDEDTSKPTPQLDKKPQVSLGKGFKSLLNGSKNTQSQQSAYDSTLPLRNDRNISNNDTDPQSDINMIIRAQFLASSTRPVKRSGLKLDSDSSIHDQVIDDPYGVKRLLVNTDDHTADSLSVGDVKSKSKKNNSNNNNHNNKRIKHNDNSNRLDNPSSSDNINQSTFSSLSSSSYQPLPLTTSAVLPLDSDQIIDSNIYLQHEMKQRDEEYNNIIPHHISSSLHSINNTKSIHWRNKTLDEMTQHDWRILREDYRIITMGSNIPYPLRFWDELRQYNVPDAILSSIHRAGYTEPTPIQRAAMPIALKDRDIIALAETGSGKTCSFLIPLLVYILNQPALTEITAPLGPYALIMAPARELAQQIYDETIKFTSTLGIKTSCIIGGEDLNAQAHRISQGCEVLIATPGRITDLITQRLLALDQCRYLVLDEADRMLDEGFEPQIKQLLSVMPSQHIALEHVDPTKHFPPTRRRTILYSATMPDKVKQLAKLYLSSDRVIIQVGDQDKKVNKRITQLIEWVDNDNQRYDKIYNALNRYNGHIIIFCSTKVGCDQLQRRIISNQSRIRRHISVCVLHSDAKGEREANLRGFRDGTYNVMVATDVAGRGIDVKDVILVINYDMPISLDAYTHRIGRTARGGASGTAITLISANDKAILPQFYKFLIDNNVPRSNIPHQVEVMKRQEEDAMRLL